LQSLFKGSRDAQFLEGRDAQFLEGRDAQFLEGRDAQFLEGRGAQFLEGRDAQFARLYKHANVWRRNKICRDALNGRLQMVCFSVLRIDAQLARLRYANRILLISKTPDLQD